MIPRAKKVLAVAFAVLLLASVAVVFVKASYTGTNVTAFPTAWEYGTPNTVYSCGHCVGFPYGDDSNLVLDSTTLYSGNPSIKINPATAFNTARECDGPWISIPADAHLVFSAYLKISASSLGDTAYTDGIRIGIDFYAANGERITGTTNADGTIDYTPEHGWRVSGDTTLQWGSSGWNLKTMDFTVPSTVESDGWGYYSAGVFVAPAYIVPWVQVVSDSDTGAGWFAATQLLINPSGTTPTPTPTPTSTPTPTPTPIGHTPTPTPTASPTPTPIEHSPIIPFIQDQTVTVNMADSAITTGEYYVTLNPTYPAFTATFDFANTTMSSSGEAFYLFDANQNYGWNLDYASAYSPGNLCLFDNDGGLTPLMTFSGVPSTVTFSFNGTTITCNGQSFNYNGGTSVSQNYVNASNPITYLCVVSNAPVTGTISLSISGDSTALTAPSNPSSGETIVSSNPYTYSYYTLDYHPFGSDNSGYYETFYLSAPTIINQVDLCLDTDGATAQPFTVSLYSETGGLPATFEEVSTNSMTGADLVLYPSWTWYNFTFSGAVYQPGYYAFTISSAGWGNQYQLIQIRSGNIQLGNAGHFFGGQWTSMGSAAYDISYYIYGSAYTAPTATATPTGSNSGASSNGDFFTGYMTYAMWIIIILGFLVLAYIVARAKTTNDRGRK